jgi:hypothetical protein
MEYNNYKKIIEWYKKRNCQFVFLKIINKKNKLIELVYTDPKNNLCSHFGNFNDLIDICNLNPNDKLFN